MVTVAVGQFSSSERPSQNLETIEGFAKRARGAGASLLALPEYSIYPGTNLEAAAAHAEPLDGEFATEVRRIARDHTVGIVVRTIEAIDDSDKAYNTLLLIDRDGEVAATYRKLHLFDAQGFRESQWISPGEIVDAPVMDNDGIRVSALTCYDLRFPETTRPLVDAGAQVVVVPAQWVPGPLKERQWTTLLHARAIENTVYVAGAAQSAPNGSASSAVVDPMGVAVADAGEAVGLITAEIDPERIAQVRARNPVLAARRFRVVADPTR